MSTFSKTFAIQFQFSLTLTVFHIFSSLFVNPPPPDFLLISRLSVHPAMLLFLYTRDYRNLKGKKLLIGFDEMT